MFDFVDLYFRSYSANSMYSSGFWTTSEVCRRRGNTFGTLGTVVYRWNKKVWEYNTVLYVRSSYSVHYIVLQLASKLLAGMLCN